MYEAVHKDHRLQRTTWWRKCIFRSPRSLFERKNGTENIVFLLSGNIMCYLIRVHQGNADSPWSGHSSGGFELHAPYFYFDCLHVGEFFRVERKFSDSEAAFPDSCQASRSLSPNSGWLYKRQQVFTPTLTVSIFLLVPFCGKRCGRDPPPQGIIEDAECEWTEQVKTPLGLGVALLASFLT